MKTGRFRLSAGCAIAALTACTSQPAPSDKASVSSVSPERATRPIAHARETSPTGAPRIGHHHGPRPSARPANGAGPARARTIDATKRPTAEGMQAISTGGPVMTAPKVLPILFPGNPFDADVRTFLSKLPGSNYWSSAVSEYGVGGVTVLPPYVPADAPPSDADTPIWLTNLLANPPSGVPAPDNNTIYAIVYPAGWEIQEGACITYGGDHWFTSMPSGQGVVYTQNPVCPNGYIGLTGASQITDSLSHEIVESSTDPFGTTYEYVNWPLSGWASACEGSASAELADLCEFQPEADYIDPQIGYMVQRSWSNAQQAAGHDPCLPHLPDRPVYFNADAVLHDGTQAYPYGYTKGISIPPGHEATIEVRLHADGPMREWALGAEEESNPHLSPDVYKELSFSWSEPRGRDGDVRYLTIKRSPPPDGGTTVFLRVAITSTFGQTTNKSWLVVGAE